MNVELRHEHDFRIRTDLIQVREDGDIGRGCPCDVQKSAEDQIDIIINPEGRSAVVCLNFNSDGKLHVELRGDDNKPHPKTMAIVFDDIKSEWQIEVATP